MQRARNRRCGNAILEFTLTAVPLVFMQLSIFEICRGMWNYHTLAESVQTAARTASVRGAGCAVQACAVTVDGMARIVAAHGLGLPADQLNLTLTSNSGAVTCHPLQSCFGNGNLWPPPTANTAGMEIAVEASYPFRSAICVFVPGSGGVQTPVVTFRASSRQTIVF